MAKKTWIYSEKRKRNLPKARATAKKIWELGKKEYAKTHK